MQNDAEERARRVWAILAVLACVLGLLSLALGDRAPRFPPSSDLWRERIEKLQ